MGKTTKLFSVLALFITSLSGCYQEPAFVPDFPVGSVEGYQPIYADPGEVSIEYLPPQPLINPAKIYRISTYLLINERYKGIHVYNNSDPENPEALGFLRVAGSTEISVRNNVLYVNHLNDLVAIKVEDWSNIQELSRIKQEFWEQDVPPGKGRYFACVDKAKGTVIGWELAVLNNPKCFR